MKHFKTALKILSLLIIGLLLAAVLFPYLFKDKIVTYLKDDINKSLDATVDFKDVSLSLFKSFPSLRISVDDLSITGVDDFDGIVLYGADKTSVDVDLSSVFGKNIVPQINGIVLDKPKINIVVIDSLRANYYIYSDTTTAADESEMKYKFHLKQYKINDGSLTYTDHSTDIKLEINYLNHSGTGDFTQDIFDLKTKSTADELSLTFDGMKYINKVAIDLDAGININLPEEKYSLTDNVLKFNDLDVTGDGFVQFSGDDIMTEFVFKTKSEDFKSLLSVIPNAYTDDFKNVKTSGRASFEGQISGIYNSAKNMMPAFEVGIKVDNGYFKYPDLPMDVKDIFANISIKASQPDYRDMAVNIPDFKLKIGDDPVSGRLMVNNLTGNQRSEGFLKGQLNLSNISKAFPLEGIQELAGNIDCDLEFDATMDDINKERYEAIKFKGEAKTKNIRVKYVDQPLITIPEATMKASPKSVFLSADNMKAGKSDFSGTVNIENPLALFSTDKSTKTDIALRSTFIDLNEWMDEDATTDNVSVNTIDEAVNEELIRNATIHVEAQVDRLKMNEYEFKNASLEGDLAANSMNIRKFNTTIEDSDIQLNGLVNNAYDYLFNNGILDGHINVKSKKLNLNYFMQEIPDNSADTIVSVIAVPENVRLKIQADVTDLIYTNLNLKNLTGQLKVENHELELTDLTTGLLGGTFNMKGLYNTTNLLSPDFEVKLDLKSLKYTDAVKSFDLFKWAVPIAEYMDGIFNTTLVMKGQLGSEMTPIFSSIDASGLLETLNGTIKGVDVLGQISNKLGLANLSKIDLVNTKNWFEINNGFVEIKEFSRDIDGIGLTMVGKHGLNMALDYNMDLTIPREMLQKNKVTAAADQGINYLEKEASKLGINIDQGPNIFVNVKITGTLKHPVFKFTPKTGAKTNLGDAVKDKINETGDAIKDTITKEIEKQKEILKDTITTRTKEEIDKLKDKAEKEGQKIIDSLKTKAEKEVVSKIDSLAKGILKDSTTQSIKDEIENKLGDEIDNIKNKLDDFNPFKKKK